MRRNNLNHLVSPLRYPGGKGCIYKFVSKLLYENDLIGINYAEPYAGGSGLALRLLVDEYVDNIFINDLDVSVYAFWYAVLNHNVELCDWVENVSLNVETWLKYREIHQNAAGGIYDLLDIAKATFYLNRTNISGVLSGGLIGGLTQNGKYKMDARFNKSNLMYRLNRLATFAHRIKISNVDGVKFVKKLNRSKKDFFIYLDPPYVEKGADLYMNFFRKKDHLRLYRSLDKIEKNWMISYDNSSFIHHTYGAYDRVVYSLSQSASNRVGKEVIVFDPKLSFDQSICNLSNAVRI